ncbi:MAG TPA: NAD(P)H-hydrate dehydratase [Oxalicibacterium sp.]|uniref:NAD(P)H-hydrate dehydratase n=1 Tax=Oxalicibacterium sp. TaxID=2766525 RepID=UPI002C33F007|nr:NAD(P)H-hydrate dehydratase [Oxalicibacterium sp.]HWU98683.1 NAD(P)H-hydrate dehydratase [Oxalicibacterium sp.]
MTHPPAKPIKLNVDLLRDWPLPMPSCDGDKEARGRVLVIGGSREMPGAVILAANAALRAGAGKLTVATGASVAQLVASAIPESRVIGLPETDDGGIRTESAELFDNLTGKIDAILIGPGMQDEPSICAFVHALLPKFPDTKIVLDACAMAVVRGSQSYQEDVEHIRDAHLILTPHAGEMAHLLGDEKHAIVADPHTTARDAASDWNAVVALKGAVTFIASPTGDVWQHEGGNVGLAISGSGDTLAGIIAGLAARGATLEQATAWGVLLHAQAGQNLAKRIGSLGYLAREIADEVPALLDKFGRRAI